MTKTPRWRATRAASAADSTAYLAVAVGLTMALGAGRAGAQTQLPRSADSSAAQLRLGALYTLAARSSPRAEAARAVARAASARVSSAKLPPDPDLQFGWMNYTLPGLRPMDALGMTQLQLMQMVPIPGKLRFAGRVAEAQADAARSRADDVRWDVRSRVAMAFYDLYQTDRSLAVAQETRRLVQDVAKTAQAMYAVGEGRQPDVLRAQVEVARMAEDIVRMQSMRSAMGARLTTALGVASDSAAAGAPALPALPDDLPPLDSLVALAAANRPMVRAGEEDLRAAQQTERLARREIWPDLRVGLQYGQRAGQMGPERMGSLMVGATVPLYARARQLKMREEAGAMRAMAAADLAAMRADTRGRVTELYADFTRARNLRALYRATVIPQAQAAVSSSLASYRVGGVNLMTLLDNQMTVNRYRQELYALDAEQGKAIAELEMLVGRELFDVNAVAPAPARSGQ